MPAGLRSCHFGIFDIFLAFLDFSVSSVAGVRVFRVCASIRAILPAPGKRGCGNVVVGNPGAFQRGCLADERKKDLGVCKKDDRSIWILWLWKDDEIGISCVRPEFEIPLPNVALVKWVSAALPTSTAALNGIPPGGLSGGEKPDIWRTRRRSAK
jgi:hypothetical protein